SAVIGEMLSDMTETSVAITSLWKIPHCSCLSVSLGLSDKDLYPYFFRTVGSTLLFGEALIDWVYHMKWSIFSVIYTNDDIGQQAIVKRADSYNMTLLEQVPIYDFSEHKIEESLKTLTASGSRIIIFPDLNPAHQMSVLKKAQSMGYLSDGWVWIVTKDITSTFQSLGSTPEESSAYNGLMLLSGLWDLKGSPAYDTMSQTWKETPVPANFIEPSLWADQGLSFNAPKAYACAEILALGLNKALNLYSGGRAQGLSDLTQNKFNATNMTPEFYSMNYSGPGGNITTFYFISTFCICFHNVFLFLSYMLNGEAVNYATIQAGNFSFIEGVKIVYLGNRDEPPTETVSYRLVGLFLFTGPGIFLTLVSLIGGILCIIMLILILIFRKIKPIMIASPIFCCIQLFGLFMAFTSVPLFIIRPTPGRCIVRKFFVTAAFALVMASIVAKNYRFQNVFTLRTSRLKSFYMLRVVALVSIVILMPFIIWYSIHPVSVGTEFVGDYSYCMTCTFLGTRNVWGRLNTAEVIVFILGCILILVGAFLAYKTRRLRGELSESSQLAFVSYNTGLAALLATPSFFLPSNAYLVCVYMRIAAILFASVFTLIVLFVPRLLSILKYIKKNNTISFCKPRKRLETINDNNNDDDDDTTSIDDYYPNLSSGNHRINVLAERNLLDFAIEAYEGVVPVKKELWLGMFSIWELKKVIVVPFRHYFIIVDQRFQKADVHYYRTCERISSNRNQYVFRVITDRKESYLFQVNDQPALDRWMRWFKGTVPSRASTTPVKRSAAEILDSDQQEEEEVFDHLPTRIPPYDTDAAPSTTFGILGSDEFDSTNHIMTPSGAVLPLEGLISTHQTNYPYSDVHSLPYSVSNIAHRGNNNPYYCQQLDDIGSFHFPTSPTPISPISPSSHATFATNGSNDWYPWPRYN
ncbi:periplasmic binding protein-like I, partial [Spinellus fusiger]